MANEFKKAEYESLRKEIADTLTEMRTLERYVVGVVGALIAWLATHRSDLGPPLGHLAWWTPFFVFVLGAARLNAQKASMYVVAEYIRGREREGWKVAERYPDGLYWETYRADRDAGVTRSFYFVWGVLFIVTLAVGLLSSPLISLSPLCQYE